MAQEFRATPRNSKEHSVAIRCRFGSQDFYSRGWPFTPFMNHNPFLLSCLTSRNTCRHFLNSTPLLQSLLEPLIHVSRITSKTVTIINSFPPERNVISLFLTLYNWLSPFIPLIVMMIMWYDLKSLKGPLSKQPCERLIVSPRRQILLEGPLQLLDSGKPVEMYLFLFDDMFIVTRRKKGLGAKKVSTLRPSIRQFVPWTYM